MAFYIFVKAKKNHPLSIRRNMREPIVRIVGGYLLLLATVRPHPPDLHLAGPFRVEVDVFAIRGILRPIVESRRCRKAILFPAGRQDRINIEFPIALAYERESLSVG